MSIYQKTRARMQANHACVYRLCLCLSSSLSWMLFRPFAGSHFVADAHHTNRTSRTLILREMAPSFSPTVVRTNCCSSMRQVASKFHLPLPRVMLTGRHGRVPWAGRSKVCGPRFLAIPMTCFSPSVHTPPMTTVVATRCSCYRLLQCRVFTCLR